MDQNKGTNNLGMDTLGRLLKDAARLSQAIDLVATAQGDGAPALVPMIKELSTTHRMLQIAYEATTGVRLQDAGTMSASVSQLPMQSPATPPTAGQSAPPPKTAPNEEVQALSDRLEKTEERFNTLKQSVGNLVHAIEEKSQERKKASENEGKSSQLQAALQDLKAKNLDLEREIARHRDVEVSLLTTMRDVRAANQAKTDFLANMSHELRTPLNAIIGFAEIMESQLVGPLGSDQYVGYARDVRKSGQHLLEVINDILDLSKIEAGQSEATDEQVDLRDTIDVCLRMVGDQAQDSGVTLVLDAISNVPHIRANARMIRQIVLNLLSNAIKFTPRDGHVTMRVNRDEDNGDVMLRVEDTGVGIADEDVERVLKPFEQVREAQIEGRTGTGLGLPMAKSLTELHDGTLELQSHVGVGTTVTVRFPASRVI